jgi:hypothetical protein
MPDNPPLLPAPFRLRTPLAAPPGWPPDVAPNQIIASSHINAIRDSVFAWPGDVDGQNHTLSNVVLVNAVGVLSDPTTTAGDLIARGAAAIARLPVGAAGQVLTVDLAAPQKLKWDTPAAAPVASVFGRVGAIAAQAGDYTVAQVTGALADPLTTRGDLMVRGAAATGRMPAGIDGQVLLADAAQPFGLRWGSESVPSVFGRSGAIAAQAGDYTAAQITNAVSTAASYPDPAWLPSLAWSKLIGVPATFTPSAHTHDAAAIATGVIAAARLGSGVADATVYLRGDGTWAAAGTGGGGGVVSVFGRAGNVIAQSGDYTAAMVTGAVSDPTTSTGDLIVRNNVNALTRLPIGANGQLLQSDPASSVGMKWTSLGAAAQTPWVTNIDAASFNLVNLGRLGVAVTVPNYAIDVVGDINYTGVLRVGGVPVVFGGSQTPWTQNINAAGFALNNVGTLGIGTSTPLAAPLVVAKGTPGAAGQVAVQDTGALASGAPVLLVTGMSSEGTRCWAVGNRGGGTFGQSLYVWNDRNSDMILATNSVERMRITAAGNVGIGHNNPQGPLHVSGVGSIFGTNGAAGCTVAAPTNANLILYQNGGGNWAGIGADGNGWLYFRTGLSGAPDARMVITSAGNVGIGTAAPACLLDVNNGAIRASGTGVAPTAGAGLELFYVPAFNWARIMAYDRSAGAYKDIKIGTSNGVQLAVNANNTVTIGDNSTACNLGVGTTVPAYRAHIYGQGGVAEASGGTFTPSLNTGNSLCLQDSGGGVYQGGAVVFGTGATSGCAAVRFLYSNSAGFGQGDLGFYIRNIAGTEAMPLVLRLTAVGLTVLPLMPTANPGAGSKALWADPADGFRVKWAN